MTTSGEGLINKERLACLAGAVLAALAAFRALEGAARRQPVPVVPTALQATGDPPDVLPEASFPAVDPAAGRDLFQRTEAWEPLAPAPLGAPSAGGPVPGAPVPPLEGPIPYPGLAANP